MSKQIKKVSNSFSLSFKSIKKRIQGHVFRMILFEGIILLIGFINGLFTNPKTQKIAIIILILSVLYSLYILFKKYNKIFLSITVENNYYKVSYLSFGKKKLIIFKEVEVETKIQTSNFSTKSTIPVKIRFLTENDSFYFYLFLKEAILLFDFLEENKGTIKKGINFKTSLKELRSNEEYKDVYKIIDRLIDSSEGQTSKT